MTTVRKIQPIIECGGYIRILNNTGNNVYLPGSHLCPFKARVHIWCLPRVDNPLGGFLPSNKHAGHGVRCPRLPGKEQILPDHGPQVDSVNSRKVKEARGLFPEAHCLTCA